jgi:hypothetical protein
VGNEGGTSPGACKEKVAAKGDQAAPVLAACRRGEQDRGLALGECQSKGGEPSLVLQLNAKPSLSNPGCRSFVGPLLVGPYRQVGDKPIDLVVVHAGKLASGRNRGLI